MLGGTQKSARKAGKQVMTTMKNSAIRILTVFVVLAVVAAMNIGCGPVVDPALLAKLGEPVASHEPTSGTTSTPPTGGGGGGGSTTSTPAIPMIGVNTLPATNMGIDAVLNGEVSAPDGVKVTHWFEYGTSLSFGNQTALRTTYGNAGFGEGVFNLELNTSYYFRCVAVLGGMEGTGQNVYGQVLTFLTPTTPPPPSLLDWEQSMNEVRAAASDARSAIQTAWDAINANDSNSEPRVAVARNSLARAQVIVIKGLEAARQLWMTPKPVDRQFDIWNAVNDLRGSIRNVVIAGGYQRYRIEGAAYNRIDRDGAPQPTGGMGKTATSIAESLKTTTAQMVAARLGVQELTPNEQLFEQLLTEGDTACSRALDGFKSDTARYDAATAEKYLGESSTALLFLWIAEAVSPAADPDGKYAELIKAFQKRMPELLLKTLSYEQQVASKVGDMLRDADYALKQMFPFPSSPLTPVGLGAK